MRWTLLAFAVAVSLAAGPANRQKARAHYEKGLEGVREGDVEKAVKEFRKATEDDPGWADAHYQLGQAYLSLARWDEAEDSNRRAMELDPSHEDAKWWGRLLADAKALRRAADLTDHEIVPQAAAELKRFLDAGGDVLRFDDALSLFGIEFSKRAPVVEQVLVLLADSAQWDRMEGETWKWISRGPAEKNRILRTVFEIYAHREVWAKALDWVRLWEAESPEDPLGVLSSLGLVYLKEGKEAEAAALYERLSAELKENPDLVCYRVDEEFLGHFGGAFEAVELLRRSVPKYTDEALVAGVEGSLHISGIVDLDGTLRGPKIEGQGLGYGLDEAALNDLLSWRFKPPRINGTPVRQHVSMDVSFSLKR